LAAKFVVQAAAPLTRHARCSIELMPKAHGRLLFRSENAV